jgi:hypothetical protein
MAFNPDWTKHTKAAAFKRNDQMLNPLPIGFVVFPGAGIQDNIAEKARSSAFPYPNDSYAYTDEKNAWIRGIEAKSTRLVWNPKVPRRRTALRITR